MLSGDHQRALAAATAAAAAAGERTTTMRMTSDWQGLEQLPSAVQ
jgi:hypothetical protein